MILVGDVRGPRTTVALFEAAGKDLRLAREATFPSRSYHCIEEIVDEIVGDERDVIDAACFAVAARVREGKVVEGSLPWELDEADLAEHLGTARVKLLDDMQATAHGMLFLAEKDFEVLQAGTAPPKAGNIAVIAPGEGFGEAMLYWDGRRYHPIATAGGRAAFAPRTDGEIELLRRLCPACGGEVTCERILSRESLRDLYAFLRARRGEPEPAWLTELFSMRDASDAIAETGLADQDPICVETLELFASLLGTEAANHALRCSAEGGVIIGGALPPSILPVLRRGGFLEAFVGKGRSSEWLRGLRLRVALETHAPLIGAAHWIASRDTT
ncbi:MAG TPA: glucokinase [Planctomycetota bacterium]|nr:glucokinase [Planctomycetota bacterium]